MTFLGQLHSLAHVLHEVLHAGVYIFVTWTSLQAPLFCRGLAFCRSLSEKSGLGFSNCQVDYVCVLVVVLLAELSSSYGPGTTLCTIDGDVCNGGVECSTSCKTTSSQRGNRLQLATLACTSSLIPFMVRRFAPPPRPVRTPALKLNWLSLGAHSLNAFPQLYILRARSWTTPCFPG